MFVARIALAHAFKKTDTNVAEQLTSSSVLARFGFELWRLELFE